MDASVALLLGLLSGCPNIPSYGQLQQHLTHNVTLQASVIVWTIPYQVLP